MSTVASTTATRDRAARMRATATAMLLAMALVVLVARQFVDAVTGELVESEDQVKGFETAKGRFLLRSDWAIAQHPLHMPPPAILHRHS